MVRDQDLARRKPFLILAAVCLLLSLAACWLYFSQAAKITDEVFEGVNKEASELEDVSKKIEAIAKEQENLKVKVTPLLLASAERSAWAEIIDELGSKLPAKFIWITEMQPVSGRGPSSAEPPGPPRPGQRAGSPSISALEIKGLYLDNPPNVKEARIVDEFVENLKGSPVFALPDDKAKIITQRTTPTGESWAYGYTLVLPLRKPITLP
jgi:Tfp pilus assembly protein PilN